MNHLLYTRVGNRFSLGDLEDLEGLSLIRMLQLDGIIPKNVLIQIDGLIYAISQTKLVPDKNQVLYLLREKSDITL